MSAGSDRRLIYSGDLEEIQEAIAANEQCGGGKKAVPKGAEPE